MTVGAAATVHPHAPAATGPYLYSVDDDTCVEVWVEDGADGEWWPGELRMRTQGADGRYRYNAAWTRDHATRLDTFDQDQVRADAVDRSLGRG